MTDPAGRYDALPTWSRGVPDGPPVQLRQPRIVPTPATGGRVEVRAGERLDHLAARVLADPYAWWQLADANPGVGVDDLDRAGRLLRLPRPGSR
ncbi:hypothetical protein [uncultured Cellulomonas sp.]|uniref:hypothetical protein n=1 Tax=uncultured Cellulomonas sp. TaxID=189682 RepID=UPI00260B0723|nr:hypothetical protein [uncultured Cellulomonas sp.]